MTGERIGRSASGGLSESLTPEVRGGLAAIGRVSRALVGAGSLPELAGAALTEMRHALGLSVAALVLLRSEDELPSVLASFYALGARRGGWLVHRALPGEADADRARLADAGLAVETLEAAGHLMIEEFDPAEAPEHSTERWERALDEALGRGYSALWYSRFAVGRDAQQYATVLLFEEAWDRCFRGRAVVTLCPYIVGELSAGAALDRLARVAELHRGVIVEADDGLARLSRA